VLDEDVLELQQKEHERQLHRGLLIKIKPFEVITLKLTLQ